MRRVIKRFIKNKVFDRNCIQSWSYSLKHVKHKTVSSSLLKARYGFERTNAHFQFWFHIFFSFCLSIYLFKNSESLSVSFYDFIWVILWMSSLSLISSSLPFTTFMTTILPPFISFLNIKYICGEKSALFPLNGSIIDVHPLLLFSFSHQNHIHIFTFSFSFKFGQ